MRRNAFLSAYNRATYLDPGNYVVKRCSQVSFVQAIYHTFKYFCMCGHMRVQLHTFPERA